MIRVGLCLSYNSYPILSCPVLSCRQGSAVIFYENWQLLGLEDDGVWARCPMRLFALRSR